MSPNSRRLSGCSDSGSSKMLRRTSAGGSPTLRVPRTLRESHFSSCQDSITIALARLSSVHLRSSPRFQKETRIASGRCFEGRAPTRRDDRDRISSDFQEIIFAGMQGLAAARDLPDVVIETALDYILLPEGADGRDDLYTASTGVERYFGVREGLSISLFPGQVALVGRGFTSSATTPQRHCASRFACSIKAPEHMFIADKVFDWSWRRRSN